MYTVPLVTGNIYHVFNKSIAGFKIFNKEPEFLRMQQMIKYYGAGSRVFSFSHYQNSQEVLQDGFYSKEKIVAIIAYCIMPTHIHLILRQLKEGSISIFMNNVLNSYSRYFNLKCQRRGPLWEARFRRILVESDEQLLHLTRYVHLNPVTAYLVNKPQDWHYSSYHEYISGVSGGEKLCSYEDILEIKLDKYRKFVEESIDYQRELARIKNLLLDQNSTA